MTAGFDQPTGLTARVEALATVPACHLVVTVQYSTVQYSTVQYSTVQYRTVTVQYQNLSTVPYSYSTVPKPQTYVIRCHPKPGQKQ